MTYRDDLQIPAGAKGWRDPRPWSDVEEAAVLALAQQSRGAKDGWFIGFTLSYVPYSPLGEQHDADLSWEVNPGAALAGHPAATLEEWCATPADAAVAYPGGIPEEWAEVLQQWRGWSELLRELARLCCHLPDPLFATVDITLEHVVGSGRWSWTVGVPVLAEEGYDGSEWTAPDPARALRAALEQADLWLLGLRAGHLLELDDTPPL